MTIPPPPDRPPTVGVEPFDLKAFADRLGQIIAETPEERAARTHLEREAAFKAAGETEEQRKARLKAAELDRKRRQEALWRQPYTERASRLRRWVALTLLSASLGYAIGAVQALAAVPRPVAIAAFGAAWALDLKMRGWGRVRVSQVRRPVALTILVIVRIPVASAAAAAAGLAPLLHATHL